MWGTAAAKYTEEGMAERRACKVTYVALNEWSCKCRSIKVRSNCFP